MRRWLPNRIQSSRPSLVHLLTVATCTPLWEQVQQRRTAHAQSQLTNGKARGGRLPKYLLSGLLKCALCGSSFIISGVGRYACNGHISRGSSVCTNSVRVAKKLVDDRCLAALREELLTPDAVEQIIRKTTRLIAARNRERQPEREHLQRLLTKVETEIMNIMSAIKAGILTASTKAELEQAEAERERLREALKTSATKADKLVTLLPRAQERYRALVQNFSCLSEAHIAQAREQIRDLAGEIRLIPTADGNLEAELTGRYEGLMKLAVGESNLVAGEGFSRYLAPKTLRISLR